MKGFSVLPAVRLAAMIAVVIASQAQQVTAGDCGCRRPAPLLPFAHAAVLPAAIPMPVLMPGCPCAGGMQLVSPGHVWSGGGWFTDSVVLHGGVSSLPAVPAWPGSMTDGGVHYRYPNYSYRYPWNHPGPAVPHVNIVW
ncbi:MAG: hypothetical protein ACKO3T_05220 [Planctomycetaceae bacterium]|jgi:hypothetical protein